MTTKGDATPIATVYAPSSPNTASAIVLGDKYEEDFLFRIVLLKSKGSQHLGIIENVILEGELFGHPAYAERKVEMRCELGYGIQQALMREASSDFAKTATTNSYQACIVLEEAHEFVPSQPHLAVQNALSTLFSISTKEYRKYGLGHIFIDQSLKALCEDLQIQTYLLGATTTPGDLEFLRSRLGEYVTNAVQRTRSLGDSSTWVAYGVATPLMGTPWEIEGCKAADEAFASETR